MIKNCNNCIKRNVLHPFLHLMCQIKLNQWATDRGGSRVTLYTLWEGETNESNNENQDKETQGQEEVKSTH